MNQPVPVHDPLLAKADEAAARGKLEQAAQPRAEAAHYDARKKLVVIELANGASFAFPPSLAQGLEGAATADLSEIEITPMGTGLHWPRLDADLTVDGLLAGVFGSRSWMRAHAARAGRARSPRLQRPEPTGARAADSGTPQVEQLLAVIHGQMTRQEVVNTYLKPALAAGAIEMTLPDKPSSGLQKYRKTGPQP